MLRLKTLKVRGVRGIVDGPDLYFEKGGLLLCGDNGTGKSSYVDAIEKVLAGSCSSLEGRGRNVSWRRQGAHINCEEPSVELTLTDGTEDFTISLDTEITDLEEPLRNLLTAAQQQSFVLRRNTLLRFIDAAPAKRYEALEDFLKLDEYSAFETQVKDLRKSVEAKLEVAGDDKRQHELTLRERLGFDASIPLTESNCIDAANKALSVASIETLTQFEDLPKGVKEIERRLESFADLEILQKVQGISDVIDELPDPDKLSGSAQEYLAQRKECFEAESELRGHFYVQVLEKGLLWIEEDELERCPLCDSPISLADVRAHVEICVAENKRVIDLRQRQSIAHSSFRSLLKSFVEVFDRLEERWRVFLGEDIPNEAKDLIAHVRRLESTHRSLQSVDQVEEDIHRLLGIDFETVLQDLQEGVRQVLADFPDSEVYSQLYDARTKVLAISKHFIEITRLTQWIVHLETCRSQIRILVDLVETSRKKAVQKLLHAVVEVANGYIQSIHPDEKIGEPALDMKESSSGSIVLTSRFHGETGDPRGHYSEGHVDSLGLCLFLAIRRIHHTQRPELSLLFLDDIMHSVDANHRRDTANLIFEEFSDHQILITTHDPLWFEYLKIACSKTDKRFARHRIAAWTLDTGPIWGDHLSNYEWLNSEEGRCSKPSDKVMKAGLLLEEMLQNLCHNLSVSVPFRIEGDYTIGPLWGSFYSTARKNQGFYRTAEECLEDIEELRRLRNWAGAHWNEWAQTLTSSEAEAFVDVVIELRDFTYCGRCNQFIKRIAALDGVWSCKRECKRYNKVEEESFSATPSLLNGHDLIAMGIPEGPVIGRLLNALREAQDTGSVSTREAAEDFIIAQKEKISQEDFKN